MRRQRLSASPRLPRLTAVAGACIVSLCATAASAAQPSVPPPPMSTTTEVAAPADGSVVVVTNTTTSAPAPAPAPVAAPAPAPVVVNNTPVAVATAPTVATVPTDVPMPPARQEALAQKRAEKGRAMGMAIGGWAMFGSTYMVSALIGTVTLDTTDSDRMRRFGGWMTIPVVGPFAAAFNAETATGTLFTATLGVAQAAGFTMALVGTARHRRAKRDLRLMAMPTRNGGQFGMSMRF